MEVVLSMGVIALLTLLRIVTVKYSPEFCTDEDEADKKDLDRITKPS
jgi:hypothetical protein